MKERNLGSGKALIAIALMSVMCINFLLVGTPGVSTSARGGGELILKVAIKDDIKTRNILNSSDEWTYMVLRYCYDSTLREDPDTQELMPYVARCSGDEAGKLFGCDWDPVIGDYNPHKVTVTYDFTNVKFHDGVQVTVDDLLASYHMIALHPKWYSHLCCLMDNNGEPGSNFTAIHWLWIEKVYESEDKMEAKLTFRLQKDFAMFYKKTLSIPIFPKHVWEGTGKIWDTKNNTWITNLHEDFGKIIDEKYKPAEKIVIDGDFNDWADVVKTSSTIKAINPNINIIECSAENNGRYLSFYVEVNGNMLGGEPSPESTVDTLHIFIDTDQKYATGYGIHGIGADYMIQIYGWDGDVLSSALNKFNGYGNNWNNWIQEGNVLSKVKEGMLETEVDWRSLDLNEARAVDVYFHTQDYNGEEDYSDHVISNSKGVLAVTQRSVAVDVVDSSDPTLLDIKIHAIDGDIIVKNITVMAIGTANVHSATLIGTGFSASSSFVNGRAKFSLNELEIANGEVKILSVSANVADVLEKSTIGLKIAHPHDIEIEKGTVSLKTTAPFSGYTDLAYVRSIPSTVIIDGAFADWVGEDVKIDTIGDVSNENIDITRYSTSSSVTDISFYLRVDGKMVGGTAVPFRNTAQAIVPSVDSDRDTVPDDDDLYPYDFNNDGTPDVETNHDVDDDGIQDYPYGEDYWLNTTIPSDFPPQHANKFVSIYIGPVEKPEVTGEDTVFIFIDTDNSTNTGCPISNIGADKLVQIEGKYGGITKKNVYTYNAQTTEWEVDAGIAYAECDSTQLEVGVSAANLGITGDFSVYFETSDWKGEKDKVGNYITLGFSRSTKADGTRSPGTQGELICYYGINPESDMSIDGNYITSERSGADSNTIYSDGVAGRGVPPDESGFDINKALAWDIKEDSYVIGNGPFRFVEWVPGAYARIERYEDYFYLKPNIDGILFKIYKTTDAGVMAFKNGDIDYVAWSVHPDYLEDLTDDPDTNISITHEMGFTYLAFNMRKPDFGYDATGYDAGKPFRKAVAHCVDKETIVTTLLQNFGVVGYGPISPANTLWFNDNLPQYDFNLTKANITLDNAGIIDTDGDGWRDLPTIGDSEFYMLTPSADYDLVMSASGLLIATEMQKVGINVTSKPTPFNEIINGIESRDFDMYILDWKIEGTDPDYLYDLFYSGNDEAGQNYPGYNNPEFDELILASRARQIGPIQNCQEILVEDLPYDVLYHRDNIEAYRSDRFANWTLYQGSIFNFWSILGIYSPSVTMSGIVKDKDGNSIEGTNIVIYVAGTADNPVTSTTTNNNGEYSIDVPPGTYDVKIEKSGYETQWKKDVVVTADQTITIDFTLPLTTDIMRDYWWLILVIIIFAIMIIVAVLIAKRKKS